MAKILLVDDDQDFRTINRIVLEKNGYEVEEANNPETAWEKIETYKPDLICLDVMMPTGTEGFHFAYKLRRNEISKSIPVLMITSIHDKSDFRFSPEEDGDFLPVQEFVEKPIQPQELLDRVDALLKKDPMQKQKPKNDRGIGMKKS
ncbi:response regulator [candidate division KSB1 bacterium]|nr:response regulator [candidate division KSB1 bacterium]